MSDNFALRQFILKKKKTSLLSESAKVIVRKVQVCVILKF